MTAMARALHVDEAAWLARSVLTNPVGQEAPVVTTVVAEETADEKVVEEIVEEKSQNTEEVEDGDVHS